MSGEKRSGVERRGDVINKGCDVMGANNVTCGIIGSTTANIVEVGMYLRTIQYYRNVRIAVLGFCCSGSCLLT